MRRAIKKFILFFMSLSIMLSTLGTIPVFANSYPITQFDGPGPEYNCLVVGGDTWIKPGDTVGIVEGAHINHKIYLVPASAYVNNSWLALKNAGTGFVSEYALNELDGESPSTDQYYYNNNPDPDATVVGSFVSVASDPDPSYIHFGFLYWMTFTKDKQKYDGYGNAQQGDGTLYKPFSPSTQWNHGLGLQTDGDKPTITVDPPSKTTTDGSPITVNIKADDNGGCGVQQIQYRTKAKSDSTWGAVQTVYPSSHSDPNIYNGTPFTKPANSMIGQGFQALSGSSDTFSTSVTFSNPGTYDLEVKSTDNLGNGTGDGWEDYGDYTISGGTGGGGGTVTPPTTPDSGNIGTIVFTPNSTPWTNSGKISEGVGSYPVNVKYVGDSTVVRGGITYALTSITVSGSASGTISGTNGNINITTEGNDQLHAVGNWTAEGGTPTVPAESPPASPTGSSGIYQLDWTKPTVSFSITPGICNPASGAIRKASANGTGYGFFGDLTFGDGTLSGVKEVDYAWQSGNMSAPTNYKTIYTGTSNTGTQSVEIEKPVGDNLYLYVKAIDIAGNENDITFGSYEDPINLNTYEISTVCDPEWDKVFWKDTQCTQSTGVTFKVNQLPLDNTSNPVYRNAEIKKGYAFYWDISSEYLYRNNDYIEVRPSFYYWDGTTRTPVDLYYQLNNNPFIKFGSSADKVTLNMNTADFGASNGYVKIGGLPLITLTRGVRTVKGSEYYGIGGWKDSLQYSNGKIQHWYGKYFIPASSIFTKVGDSPRPENLLNKNHIIVNFTIIAYKNGEETLSQDQVYNYVANNWTLEGGPKNNKYQNGDVLVYDNSHSLLDDYTTLVTH